MQSKATSVGEYLGALPADRRDALEAVRRVILTNVDGDIEEGMQYGMIGYFVPHRVFPDGYHCAPEQPLPYMALASQKQHMSLYLMFAYTGGGEGERWIRDAYAAKGRTLDMGKSCVRFKRLQDLDLEIIAAAIRRAPSREYIATYTAARPAPARKK